MIKLLDTCLIITAGGSCVMTLLHYTNPTKKDLRSILSEKSVINNYNNNYLYSTADVCIPHELPIKENTTESGTVNRKYYGFLGKWY